jgi:hypothetical protein
MYLSQEVADLHSQGLTQKQIALRLSCGLNTVRRRMKEQKLCPKSVGSRNYNINSHVFDVIDTEEKAYWLGFFLADACLAVSAGTRRSFRLSLKKQDEKHVKKAASFLGFKGNLIPDNRDNHPRMLMVFNDVELCQTLMNHGWWNYKTGESFEILDIIRTDLFHHFVRGYYDGDGCITYRRRKRKNGDIGSQKRWYCNIACKYAKALEIMNETIVGLNGPHSEVRRRSKAFDIRWSNKDRVSKILDFMYKDATIYLKRKVSRKHEFDGLLPFVFNNIGDFTFNIRTDDLIARKDCDQIVSAFTSEVLTSKWKHPKYDYKKDFDNAMKNPDLLENGSIVAKSAVGNKFILKYQPMVWYVSQNKGPALANFASHRSTVIRAIKQFCGIPNRNLSPQRFIRELRFAGFSIASLLASPVILAAIKHFKLSGKWFDPCAGWGNRLLASKIADVEYEATDPGVSFKGLTEINTDLEINATIHNEKWQDLNWPSADFVLTSPPFHDKENYLDGIDYGKFGDWYVSFLKPLILRSVGHVDSVVLHVDGPMKAAIESDFTLDELPIISNSRHKAPEEWFVRMN